MRLASCAAIVVTLAGCPRPDPPRDVQLPDVPTLPPEDIVLPTPASDRACGTPGALKNPQRGAEFCTLGVDVAGADAPAEFCVRRFAGEGAPRVLAFAPNGDLFVAAPSGQTP